MNRPALKSQARQIILDNLKTVLIGSALVVLLSFIFSEISDRLMQPATDQLTKYYELMLQGKYDAAVRVANAFSIPQREVLVDRMLQLLLSIVEFGYLLFLFNIILRKPASYGNLLDSFAIWWKILLLELVMAVFIALWSLLLIIPGIIAAYRYRMARFLLLTHPEYGLMDCIRESKRRTQGYKMAFFLLDLSFLGWWLLTLIPILGWVLMIWVVPYRTSANLLYCMQLSEADDRALWEMPDPRFPSSEGP